MIAKTLMEYLDTDDDVVAVMATPPTTVGTSSSPDTQGTIRRVKNAHLVHKKMAPDGTYTELWVYNCGRNVARDELDIKKDILTATDIQLGETVSPDGTQSYELWSVGNVQMIQIQGLVQ